MLGLRRSRGEEKERILEKQKRRKEGNEATAAAWGLSVHTGFLPRTVPWPPPIPLQLQNIIDSVHRYSSLHIKTLPQGLLIREPRQRSLRKSTFPSPNYTSEMSSLPQLALTIRQLHLL